MQCLCQELAGPGIELDPACIGSLWIFQNLAPEDTQALAMAALRKKFQPGETIFYQGDKAVEMFLIKAGRVKLTKYMEDGSELTLDIRKGGDILGEGVLDEDADYSLTACCVEQTITCGFSKAAFEKLVMNHPSIGLQVIKNLGNRINSLTSRVSNMSLTGLENRLYSVLITVAKEHGIRTENGLRIQFPLTHEELSFLVGAHRVSITKAMKALKKAGRLSQEGKTLIIYPEQAA
jgi:CRP/FNR family transcriptional regulator